MEAEFFGYRKARSRAQIAIAEGFFQAAVGGRCSWTK